MMKFETITNRIVREYLEDINATKAWPESILGRVNHVNNKMESLVTGIIHGESKEKTKDAAFALAAKIFRFIRELDEDME